MHKCITKVNGRASDSASATDTWVCELSPGTTVREVIKRQGLPEVLCAIVLIDGQWREIDTGQDLDRARRLVDSATEWS